MYYFQPLSLLTMHKQHQPQRNRAGFGRSRISFAGRVVSLCLVGLMVLQLPGTAIYPIFAPLLHASPMHDVPQHDVPLDDVPMHHSKDNEPDCHTADEPLKVVPSAPETADRMRVNEGEGHLYERHLHKVKMDEGQMHDGQMHKHQTQADANRNNRSAHDCCDLQPEPSDLSALGTLGGSSPLTSCAHSSSANSCASDSSCTHGSSGTHCDSAEVCGCSIDQTSTRPAFTLPPVLSSLAVVCSSISPVPFFDTGLTADSNDRNPGTLDSPPLYLLYDTWLI